MTAYAALRGLTKRFGDVTAAQDVTLDIARGEILALLGPSGSGKTTLLRLLAGFETPDAGSVTVAGEDVTRVRPERRHFGMVFQHYALFPHLDVRENIAFGLEARHDRSSVRQQVERALELVDLTGYGARKVHELSGGQQQRVALARALAPEPRVLLLDEPLSNLDPTLRERTRRELRAVIERVGITTIFVTHEQEEAFDLGDRIALLEAGRLVQTGSAEDLYERPANLFAATFVGRANIFRGAMARVFGGTPGSVIVARPERLRFADRGVAGVVRARRYLGSSAFFVVESDGAPGEGTRFDVLAAPHAAAVGDRVYVQADGVLAFPEGHGA